jgi:hypothetical protein
MIDMQSTDPIDLIGPTGPTERRQATLERGLAEFDRTVRRRYVRRRVVRFTLSSLAIVLVVVIATRFGTDGSRSNDGAVLAGRPLPRYVEVIRDDAQLTLELELASACERIGRGAGGRVYVVECSLPSAR